MARIRFVDRKDIDLDRWDQCVLNSTHSDIYARSAWLDIMAKHWSGLVQDDYQAVLPIPWNRKFFLSYIYTPRFTSPLPLCGHTATTLPLREFLDAIPPRFIRWDLDLTTPQATEEIPYPHRQRTNHILALGAGYETIFGGFRPGYRHLVRQAERTGLNTRRTDDFVRIIGLASRKKKIRGMKPDDYQRFTQLCELLAPQNMVEAWEALSPHDEVCAAMVLLRDQRKLYYLVSWNNDYGRKKAASHLLMARILEAHAEESLLFDFEGSDVEGIRHFIEGFGPQKIPYYAITKR